MSVLLDASAALALFLGEKGDDVVRSQLSEAAISSVNMAEVYSKVAERGLDPEIVQRLFMQLSVPIISFGSVESLLTGRLRPLTQAVGLSVGDRACIATAIVEKRRILTADRAWSTLDLGVAITLIR